MQLEDRVPDGLDGLSERRDPLVQPNPYGRRDHLAGGGLQGQPGGEQSLDDVVMHVPRDPRPLTLSP